MKKWITVAVVFFVSFGTFVYLTSADTKQFREENGIRTTVTGARMYTVVWKGCEYVVIEKHSGIGISPVGIPNRLPADDIFNIPKNIK